MGGSLPSTPSLVFSLETMFPGFTSYITDCRNIVHVVRLSLSDTASIEFLLFYRECISLQTAPLITFVEDYYLIQRPGKGKRKGALIFLF